MNILIKDKIFSLPFHGKKRIKKIIYQLDNDSIDLKLIKYSSNNITTHQLTNIIKNQFYIKEIENFIINILYLDDFIEVEIQSLDSFIEIQSDEKDTFFEIKFDNNTIIDNIEFSKLNFERRYKANIKKTYFLQFGQTKLILDGKPLQNIKINFEENAIYNSLYTKYLYFIF